jgi:beta-glucosidase
VGEGSDAASFTLPGVQEQLMQEVLQTGKPVVVVLVSGRPYTIDKAVTDARAILCTWLPGEGGGEAIARTLVGLNNPSGKTPLSFPKSVGSMPYFYNHTKKAGGLPVQKQFGTLYPFGHGLSYTSFTWSDFQVEQSQITNTGEFKMSLQVQNSGTVAGDEVVELYIHDKVASLVRPVKELKAFARVSLKPGEKKKVVFSLPAELFSFIGERMERVLESGSYELFVGKSCDDIVFTSELSILGEDKVLSNSWRCLSSSSIVSLS